MTKHIVKASILVLRTCKTVNLYPSSRCCFKDFSKFLKVVLVLLDSLYVQGNSKQACFCLYCSYADNNAISNATEYGDEAFPTSQKYFWAQKEKLFTPFSTYTALHTLYVLLLQLYLWKTKQTKAINITNNNNNKKADNNGFKQLLKTEICTNRVRSYIYKINFRILFVYLFLDCFPRFTVRNQIITIIIICKQMK